MENLQGCWCDRLHSQIVPSSTRGMSVKIRSVMQVVTPAARQRRPPAVELLQLTAVKPSAVKSDAACRLLFVLLLGKLLCESSDESAQGKYKTTRSEPDRNPRVRATGEVLDLRQGAASS
ncbi:hypothetical protein F2P81_002508 [Scophthalmus maximus]|uniref:Uncharacterized protein n=1 Tax=Scophthalmus maximus TaxID=52904 RepID=A0A6A4TMB5_SCOMX|nr:hypothetical protein F2P81_002508 [Scophthalmus maximus]